jgi:hypothetical protein
MKTLINILICYVVAAFCGLWVGLPVFAAFTLALPLSVILYLTVIKR